MQVIDFVSAVLPYFGNKDFTQRVKDAWVRDHDEKSLETLFILRLVSFSAEIIRQKKVIVSLQKELERVKSTTLF